MEQICTIDGANKTVDGAYVQMRWEEFNSGRCLSDVFGGLRHLVVFSGIALRISGA